MKKKYSTPNIQVMAMHANEGVCQTSGKYDKASIVVEEEESLVKGNSYSGNPVEWENWE